MKTIPQLKSYQHFQFESDNKFVKCREHKNADFKEFVLSTDVSNISSDLPDVIKPAGLSVDRQ